MACRVNCFGDSGLMQLMRCFGSEVSYLIGYKFGFAVSGCQQCFDGLHSCFTWVTLSKAVKCSLQLSLIVLLGGRASSGMHRE